MKNVAEDGALRPYDHEQPYNLNCDRDMIHSQVTVMNGRVLTWVNFAQKHL